MSGNGSIPENIRLMRQHVKIFRIADGQTFKFFFGIFHNSRFHFGKMLCKYIKLGLSPGFRMTYYLFDYEELTFFNFD
jgi:hypothetical protein